MINKINEYSKACIEIAEAILELEPRSKEEIAKIKKEISRKYRLPKLPADPDILTSFRERFGECNELVQ
ncbi:MAG: tRNA uridine(34) 5-carboxymethylaminomethyl modification radical SAM/GNAT enzyme Elp3, partial [Archaeoglobales archaeon]